MKVLPNESGHDRGLHVVIINNSNGKIEFAKVFDTFKSSSQLEQFITQDFLEIPPGSIIVLACKDECTKEITEGIKKWLINLGCYSMENLKYRCGFVFIGFTGEGGDEVPANEKRALKEEEKVEVVSMFKLTKRYPKTRKTSRNLPTIDLDKIQWGNWPGYLTVIGGMSIHLFISCLFLWGNINNYITSYYHYGWDGLEGDISATP